MAQHIIGRICKVGVQKSRMAQQPSLSNGGGRSPEDTPIHVNIAVVRCIIVDPVDFDALHAHRDVLGVVPKLAALIRL